MNAVKFDDLHSYNDFRLILNSKTIGKAEPKTELIDVPAADGELDYTEYFGEIRYKNRPLSFQFTSLASPADFPALYSRLQNLLNGRKMKITLTEDADYYYIGRVTVNDWETNKRIGKVVIDVNAEPYKLKRAQTVIHQTITEATVITCYNERKSVIPEITASAEVFVEVGKYSKSTNEIIFGYDDIVFTQGQNFLRVTPVNGAADVTIKYQEGSL